jgi:hypothetical protein
MLSCNRQRPRPINAGLRNFPYELRAPEQWDVSPRKILWWRSGIENDGELVVSARVRVRSWKTSQSPIQLVSHPFRKVCVSEVEQTLPQSRLSGA